MSNNSTIDQQDEKLFDFLIAEHKALRDEILRRIVLQHQLIALTLIAIGTFLPIGIPGHTKILLAYPILAMFIAILWSHNEVRIRQTAIYIKAIEKRLFYGSIGWEHIRQSEIANKEKFGTRSLFAARGIFIGTQVLAVIMVLIKKEFTTENLILMGFDLIVISFTVFILRRHKIRLEITLPSEKKIVKSVWDLSHPFRRAIQEATKVAFEGNNMISTTSGETVLLDDVLGYNQKAEGPLTSTFYKLNNIERSDLVKLIQELYSRLLPYFIDCGTKNPVHHTAYVIEFMVTILIGEEKAKNTESDVKIDAVKIGILAALFHDSAQGLSKLPKITEAHIKDEIMKVVKGPKTIDDLEQCLNDAVKARQEHMAEGAQIAEKVLQAYNLQHPNEIKDDEIREIKRIIEHHDDPKIPVAYNVIRRMFSEHEDCKKWREKLKGQQKDEFDSFIDSISKNYAKYLIKVNDWLLQYHHEADLLWMLTQDGIDADLARFSPAEEKTPREIIDNNINCHKEEVELYRDQPDFEEYNFRNGTVYRSKTGYMLFEYLVRILNERYPKDNRKTGR